MTRTNRTLLVFFLSVMVAGVASFFVYRAVQSIPVREVEVKSYYVAVAAKSMPIGTLLTPNDVKLVAWPASSPVAGGLLVGLIQWGRTSAALQSVIRPVPCRGFLEVASSA